MPREVTHCALVINAGTRDEGEGEAGLAHFIEHVLFKGTANRKAYHILNRMESVGGEINAYTTKEDTWITSSQRAKDTERALELLADIAFQSTFPEGELNKERDVILDEIAGVQDQPGDVIFEEFESELFQGHPLALPILGTAASVKSLTRRQVREYVSRHYRPDNMVLGVVGAVPWESVLGWAERHFGEVGVGAHAPSSGSPVRVAPVPAPRFTLVQSKGIHQVHHLTGAVAPGADSKDKLAMTVLANILGGPAMNCRLNLNIREKHGMAYHIEANHVVYQDAGVFNVYFGTDARFHGKVERLVRKELVNMRTKALGTRQLHDAKQQLLGQIALGHEHGATVLSGLAKTYLMYDRVETLASLVSAIEALTSRDLLDVANAWLGDDALCQLTFMTPAEA
jgi:predicted Zn-dependent peptidase